MDTLSTKPKTTALSFGPTLHSKYPAPIQLCAPFQNHYHQGQLEIQCQELDQYGVSDRKHETLGGAVYILVVSLHNKPKER